MVDRWATLRPSSLGWVAIFLCGTGTSALAQELTSTRDRMTHAEPERGEAARMDPLFRRMLACVDSREPGRTRTLIRTIPGSRIEARVLGGFQSRIDQCYVGTGRGIGFTWNLMRGGFAEIYYHREFPAGLASGARDAAWAEAWIRPRVAEGIVSQEELLHATARCVVVRQPGIVTRLLAGAPFSAAEVSAMRQLRGDISSCLDSGIQLTASPQSLRGLLAEAALLYGESRGAGPDGAAAVPAANRH
ncbi:MAG TPA: hypothetical protein VK614_07995 [Allosphingosinicella sp.]|nr:hypothetical protein [Allosphingosinicella sp.]